MARPNQEVIDTFISITGASESIAVQKIEEYGGDLNQAVNAYFSEGDRNATLETSTAARQDDFMDIDDDPLQVSSWEPSVPVLSAPRSLHPVSLLDPNFGSRLFNSTSEFTNRAPFVSHPREVRKIPIEVKDGNEPSNRSGLAPTIVDVTDAADDHGPEVHGSIIIDEDNDENDSPALISRAGGRNEIRDDNLVSSLERHPRPSAPEVVDLSSYSNDIEEEMIRAAIEASKQEVEEGYSRQQLGVLDNLGHAVPQQGPSHPEEDAELAHAVSLSLKTAEQEKALRGVEKVGASEPGANKPDEIEEPWKFAAPNGRQGLGLSYKGTSSHSKLEAGSSSIHDDIEDLEEQPLARRRTRHVSSGSIDSVTEVGEIRDSPPSSPGQRNNNQTQNNDMNFPSEWGGISSEEHDEAVMLEAAMFGGIPEGREYFAYGPHQLTQAGFDGTISPYPQPTSRPPSPDLTAQRLLREQQDDEYLASLQADREKELKAMEEAEARRLEEQAAREAVIEEERRREEEFHRKLEEEQEFERQLAAKEASLPNEPASDDENAVNLLIRMPDGSRRGRRFLKSDKLQLLFDFIDVGRAVKPGTYRLVRPYPRRAFGDGESALTLNELGLTSKQEALYLELI